MLPGLDSIISFFDLLENFVMFILYICIVYIDAARIRFNHSLFDVCDNFAIVVLEK